MFDPSVTEDTDREVPLTVTAKSVVCGVGVGLAKAFTLQLVIAIDSCVELAVGFWDQVAVVKSVAEAV